MLSFPARSIHSFTCTTDICATHPVQWRAERKRHYWKQILHAIRSSAAKHFIRKTPAAHTAFSHSSPPGAHRGCNPASTTAPTALPRPSLTAFTCMTASASRSPARTPHLRPQSAAHPPLTAVSSRLLSPSSRQPQHQLPACPQHACTSPECRWYQSPAPPARAPRGFHGTASRSVGEILKYIVAELVAAGAVVGEPCSHSHS